MTTNAILPRPIIVRAVRRLPFLSVVCSLSVALAALGGGPSLRADTKQAASGDELLQVGVAQIDITPEGPIRLAGYGSRQTESEGVLQPLRAKALAFGSDAEGASIFMALDLIGIPGHVTSEVAEALSEKVGLDPSRLVICATHTHSGPEVGNLLNHFNEPLPPDELARIAKYVDQLAPQLEALALAALDDRKPARVSWGQGQVDFAINRRVLDENGKWIGFGDVPNGPVDHSMPLLSIAAPDGSLRAVLVNYACHGTTLGGDVNHVHGDWMGEAQRIIEETHPGATALVAIGCGGDANPTPRLKLEHTTQHGQAISDEVDRLLSGRLVTLSAPPIGARKQIELPYAHVPDVEDLTEQLKADGAKGYYARLALERIARGEEIPESLSYTVQTWSFGDLAMVFLPGEVVVDYALRLKDETNDDRLWITAYANDVPCYIASRRVIREGGYEVDRSMYSYDHPSRFVEEIEDFIVEATLELLQRHDGR